MSYQANKHNHNAISFDYQCGACGGSVFTSAFTATRTPVYNPDNCSCVALAYDTLGNEAGVVQQSSQDLASYNHTTTPVQFFPPPISYASSNQSRNIPGPEEPEREAPTLELLRGEFGFLEVVPPPGQNEEGHRRASFRSEMSYQMRGFLLYQPESRPEGQEQFQYQHQYDTARSQPDGNRWLSQEVFVQPARRTGSGKTKSWESQESNGSGESSLEAGETMPNDPILGVGTWAQSQGEVAGGGYASIMSMSGLTEALYETERR